MFYSLKQTMNQSSIPADSSLLILDFESQQTSAEAPTEDEFDPIPVTGRKNSQGKSYRFPGEHLRGLMILYAPKQLLGFS